MSKNSLNVAIAEGKTLMKESHDAFHDFLHAQNVEQLALEILESRGWEKLPAELVGAAVYWHDVYKASKNSFRLSNIDGKASSLIARGKLQKILPKEALDELLAAVANHDRVVRYVLLPRSFSPLAKILIEADMLDMFNANRWKRGVCAQNMTYPQKFIFSLFELLNMAFILPRAFISSKSQEIYKRRSKKFWDFFLFKEKYFLKIITNRA